MDEHQPTPAADEHDEGTLPCVWFFIPLPQPMGLPHGWTYGESLPRRDLLGSAGKTSGLSCSLMVHQVPRTADILLSDEADLFDAALSAITQTPQARNAGEGARLAREQAHGELDSVITMIEAAVPIDDVEFNPDLLNAALDLAIDTIRYVQLCVAAILEHGMRLVSRATLPPVIPVFHGRLHLAPGRRPTFDQPIRFIIEDSAPRAAFGLRPVPVEESKLQALKAFVYRLGPRSPFGRYVDLRREARTQRAFEGNRRVCRYRAGNWGRGTPRLHASAHGMGRAVDT